MNAQQAYDDFEQWYEKCLESGIEPERIVAEMGGMLLITNEQVVEKIIELGLLNGG